MASKRKAQNTDAGRREMEAMFAQAIEKHRREEKLKRDLLHKQKRRNRRVSQHNRWEMDWGWDDVS